jgi:sulfoxide reductase heme-binding subunit YedZ
MLLAEIGAKAEWYLTRSTGVVALVLLTASVVLGIVQVCRWSSPRMPRFVTAGLHRNISLLVVAFVAVHVVTAVLDAFAPIRWLDAVVPFHARYRPLWLGFGALACDFLLALVCTSLVRARLGYRAWRAVHWLAYACWPVAMLHGLGAGSDTRERWVLVVDGVCLAAVVAATWARVLSITENGTRRTVVLGATAMFALALPAWVATGPLQHGWARRAGTPVSLLSSRRVSSYAPRSTDAPGASSATASTGVPATLRLPFDARVAGTVREDAPDAGGREVVVIDARLRDGARGRVHVALEGRALAGGGVELEQSRAYLGSIATPALYAGAVTELDGAHVGLALRRADGRRAHAELDLSIDESGRVTGRIDARPDGGS